MTSTPGFIHLRVHTEYSLVDGVVRVKPLMDAVSEDAMPAVALLWTSGVIAQNQDAPYPMVMLAQTHQGYLNLSQLISRSYLENQHRGVPIIQAEWIQPLSEGIIALSGGRHGDVGRALLAGQKELAQKRLDAWLD